MFDVLERIKELRELRGWSVYRLAQMSNIPQSTIATWYQKSLYPPIDKIELICETFGISLSEFFSKGYPFLLTKEQTALIEKWNLLSLKEKSAVMSVIDVFTTHEKS